MRLTAAAQETLWGGRLGAKLPAPPPRPDALEELSNLRPGHILPVLEDRSPPGHKTDALSGHYTCR